MGAAATTLTRAVGDFVDATVTHDHTDTVILEAPVTAAALPALVAIAASGGDDWRRAGARLFSRAAVEAGAEALLSERWIAREAALASATAAASRAGCAQNPAPRPGAWLRRARRLA